MKIGSLFSGYEGLGMAVQSVLGGDIAWVSDIDPGACKILAHRYPDVPNIGDITTVDWSAVEPVDVMTGGFPCQDVSCAGLRKGLRPDTRSGVWTQMAYAIDQLRPSLVLIENVRGLLSAEAHSDLEPCPWCVGDGSGVPLRALGAVLGDLADIGYDASWQGLRAADVGAPHGRFRVFVTAWPAADVGRLRGGSRRLAVAGEAPGGRTLGELAGRGRASVADSYGDGLVGQSWSSAGRHALRLDEWDDADRRGDATAAHPEGQRRGEGRPEPARLVGRPNDALGGDGDAAHADVEGLEGSEPAAGHELPTWGPYGDAVRRWERLTRPAPAPTEPGKTGAPRLSPRFVEWMQGLPTGWVTDVPGLTRNEQLKALGNGVVPQQAAQALRLLLPDVGEAAA